MDLSAAPTVGQICQFAQAMGDAVLIQSIASAAADGRLEIIPLAAVLQFGAFGPPPAIPQRIADYVAVSLPTLAARVGTSTWSCGFGSVSQINVSINAIYKSQTNVETAVFIWNASKLNRETCFFTHISGPSPDTNFFNGWLILLQP